MEIAKKSYEISYALCRIADNLKNKNFADHLEYQALRLLTSSAVSDLESLKQSAGAIETILRFGADVNVISVANKELILSAIGELNSAIADSQRAEKVVEEMDLNDIFSGSVLINAENNRQAGDYVAESNRQTAANNGQAYPAERQAAILERIRQNNDCRLKDIQFALPDVSERTIRYDLQKLCEQGLVERVGNGGPGSYYKIKSVAPLEI